MSDSYEDMLYLPHPVSQRHPQMSLEDRAAQFSPFAALTGYEEAVQETARLTNERVELDEDAKERLNERLMYVRDTAGTGIEFRFTYFIPDQNKSGGAYTALTGAVKKIDEYKKIIILTDGTHVPIKELIEIE